MGIKEGETVKEADVEMLARMEHARWNMEKLLVGYCALKETERNDLNREINGRDTVVKENAKLINIRLKKEEFKHKDIAPYDELPEDSKEFDRAIVRNLADVIKDL